MIHFKKITWINFLSGGNSPNSIILDKSPSTIVVGTNGAGKCLRKNTTTEIEFTSDEIKEKYLKFIEKKL